MTFSFRYLLIFLYLPSIGQQLPGAEDGDIKRFSNIDLNIKIQDCVRVIESESFENDSTKNKRTSIIEYILNKKGVIKKLIIKKIDNSFLASYEFDRYSRITLKEVRNTKTIYSYSENKLTILGTTYADSGKLLSTHIVHFNQDYKPIKKEYYNGETVLTHRYLLEYNSRGDLTKEIFENTPLGPGVKIDFKGYKNFKPTSGDTINYLIDYYSDTIKIHKKTRFESLTKKYQKGDTLISESITFFPEIKTNHKKIRKTIGEIVIEEYYSNQLKTITISSKGKRISDQSFQDGFLKTSDLYTYKIEKDRLNHWTKEITYQNNVPVYTRYRTPEYK